ncbi:tetratricopeptide repeat protein [Terracidiphilus gabretensis]|jgi:tetratricopeptide (TPR) repeat protein|uniref:tetratricopeptide repeat protein n=1 Tax=Terracidiphilus gabretensis TaxID=1577687 RepID=UPI00071B2692|nr:tetratricopeptide repeat protein [Terracidiphilus gabretensis]
MPTAVELIAEGKQARAERDLDAARAYYAEAAEAFRKEDNRLAYAHAIRHIADMFLDEARHAEAGPLYEEALEIYRSSLDTKLLDLANTVRPYALLNETIGNVDLAREHWQEARNLYASLHLDIGVDECGKHLARLS